jgi:hypothetical protein
VSFVCRFFLQQQLSEKSKDVMIQSIIWTQVPNPFVLE